MLHPSSRERTVPVNRGVGETAHPTLYVLLGGRRVVRACQNGIHGIRSYSLDAELDGKKDYRPVVQTLLVVEISETDDSIPPPSRWQSPDGCDPRSIRSGGAYDVPLTPRGNIASLPSACVKVASIADVRSR